jgi:hypothetical protein
MKENKSNNVISELNGSKMIFDKNQKQKKLKKGFDTLIFFVRIVKYLTNIILVLLFLIFSIK